MKTYLSNNDLFLLLSLLSSLCTINNASADNAILSPIGHQFDMPDHAKTYFTTNLFHPRSMDMTVNYTQFVRPEHIDQEKLMFLFFIPIKNTSKKIHKIWGPYHYQLDMIVENIWFYGVDPLKGSNDEKAWRTYQLNKGQIPSPYTFHYKNKERNIEFIAGKGKGVVFYTLSTGQPVDISRYQLYLNTRPPLYETKKPEDNIEGGGLLFSGYGIGSDPVKAWQDMLSSERYDIIFNVQATHYNFSSVMKIKSVGIEKPPETP